MPEWVVPIKITGQELDEIFEKVNQMVGTNPPAEDVFGMSMQELFEHGKRSTQKFMEHVRAEGSGHSLLEIDTWVVLYMMGFVVGVQYQKERQDGESHDEDGQGGGLPTSLRP